MLVGAIDRFLLLRPRLLRVDVLRDGALDDVQRGVRGLDAVRAGRVDAALLVAAHRAAAAGKPRVLDQVAQLAAAWRGTAETALETMQQGTSFTSITAKASLALALRNSRILGVSSLTTGYVGDRLLRRFP